MDEFNKEIDILCLINGSLTRISNIWNRYKLKYNDKNNCIIPKDELIVNSLDNNHKITKSKIVKIIRRKVNKIRNVKLENGYAINITNSQYLLNNNGWTNDIKVGDYICIPKKLYVRTKIKF
jgi:hypothetical protein